MRRKQYWDENEKQQLIWRLLQDRLIKKNKVINVKGYPNWVKKYFKMWHVHVFKFNEPCSMQDVFECGVT